MEIYALAIFGIAALGGLVLAASVLRQRLAPWPLSLAHAGLGAAGLVLLGFVVVVEGGGSSAGFALILLVVAALGGFFLASFHFRRLVPPSAMVAVHALVAVAGFVTLLAGVLGLV